MDQSHHTLSGPFAHEYVYIQGYLAYGPLITYQGGGEGVRAEEFGKDPMVSFFLSFFFPFFFFFFFFFLQHLKRGNTKANPHE